MGVEPISASEVCEHALRHTKGPLSPWWYEERWLAGIVDPRQLRTGHTDFRLHPLTRNERMTSILDRAREAIVDGSFPEAEYITSAATELATIAVRRDEAGELFVVDGQCRSLTAQWQGRDQLDDFVWQETGTRTLAD